jgi:hypothetical protein
MNRIFWVLIFYSLVGQNAMAKKKATIYATNANIINLNTKVKPINHACCSDFASNCPDTTLNGYNSFKYVRTNVHFLRRSNGTGNFDGMVGELFAWSMLDRANLTLNHLQPLALYTGKLPQAKSTGFNYILSPDKSLKNDSTGVYFENDDSMYLNYSPVNNSEFNSLVYDKYGHQKGHALNVFMLEYGGPATIIKGKPFVAGGGVSFGNYLKIFGAYANNKIVEFMPNGDTLGKGGWCAGKGMNHEGGHSLGLMHTWTGDDCGDTPNNNNCYNFDSLDKRCNKPSKVSNNMMDYNVSNDGLSPCQIGKIHLQFSTIGSETRNWLEPTWCHYRSDKTLWLTKGDTVRWRSARDLEGDIFLSNNTTLIIYCRVSLAQKASVILNPGCTIIVDGGTIHNACGNKWKGINLGNRKRKTGKIILKNGGEIKDVEGW